MGNAFASDKGDQFDYVDTSTFTTKELEAIGLRYLEIQAHLSTQICDKGSASTLKSEFLPQFIDLMKAKGILISLETFTSFLGDGMRVNSSKTLDLFWDLSVGSTESTGKEKLLDFFRLLISLMGPQEKLVEANTTTLVDVAESLTKAVLASENLVSDNMTELPSVKKCYELLKRWVSVSGPCVPQVFESYLTETCFPSLMSPSFSPFRPPKIEVQSYLLSNGPSGLIPLSLYCDALQGQWRRLYSSSLDGVSFNRMVHHILGYEGPLCFLIKPRGFQNSLFGAFTTGRWKEFNRFYGSSDAFLFTLQPEFKIMRSRNRSNGNYQWLNTKSYGMPHGLALGGSMESFRLFITDTFENCVASESCLTFEGGCLLPEAGLPAGSSSDSNTAFAPLVSKSDFEIDHIEVYACGGEKFIQSGMKALEKDREIRDENIQKARQVDKAQFFNNAFDQEFLLSGTFAHKAQTADNSEIP